MNNDWQHERQVGNSIVLLNAMDRLSFVLAIGITLFCAPMLYQATSEAIGNLTVRTYGYSAIWWVDWVYYFLCFAATFFLARAFLLVALITATIAAAVRYV